MPKIPIVSHVVNLKDQKVRAAAYVVNSPGAWLPEPEIIGQGPKPRSKWAAGAQVDNAAIHR
jgi:hypothetical protein